MSRLFSDLATIEARQHLGALLEATHEPERYRAAMIGLGRDLGIALRPRLAELKRILVVSTAEDADFLTSGCLEELSAQPGAPTISLACFWNDRKRIGERVPLDIAPILRRYVEPFEAPVDAMIVLKSIISGACVVRTNLMEMLGAAQPQRVVVLAPVILKGAQQRLGADFPRTLSAKFEYLYFAEDDEKVDGIVVPGIGGEVYDLLGLKREERTRFRPNLVRDREEWFALPQ